MHYLFNQWKKLRPQLAQTFIFICLDYDGTLTPIAATPKQALPSIAIVKTLRQLANLSTCKLAIISGRTLNNIKNLIPIKNLLYVGNHGLELGNLTNKITFPINSRYKKIIKKIKKILIKQLHFFKGVFLEDKGITLSLHYRLAAKKDIALIKTIFYQSINRIQAQSQLKIMPGKKVLEILPPLNWNKGKILKLLLAILHPNIKNIIPIYIGDDATDEHAFKILKKSGITIAVGKIRNTQAKYYVKNTREVLMLLGKILKLKTKQTH